MLKRKPHSLWRTFDITTSHSMQRILPGPTNRSQYIHTYVATDPPAHSCSRPPRHRQRHRRPVTPSGSLQQACVHPFIHPCIHPPHPSKNPPPFREMPFTLPEKQSKERCAAGEALSEPSDRRREKRREGTTPRGAG